MFIPVLIHEDNRPSKVLYGFASVLSFCQRISQNRFATSRWNRSRSFTGNQSHARFKLSTVSPHAEFKAARDAILALGSRIPKPEFIDLDAGFEYFTKHGVALPEESIK